MHFRIRSTFSPIVVSVFALFFVAATPTVASAHIAKGSGGTRTTCRSTRHDCETSGSAQSNARPSRATPQVSQAKAKTLIFGNGDTSNGGSGISPTEPLTNLQNILTTAGYGVDVSPTLPKNINQYKAIWFLDDNPLSTANQVRLEAFVNDGGGLYLTGEEPADAALDNADTSVINDLVSGGGIEAGGQGNADSPSAPNPVNQSAIDDVALIPNQLTTWTPNEPGGMSGVAASNVLTSTSFTGVEAPTGAVWDGSSMTSGLGRLAILMDINWLESEFWDPTTAPQVAVNLQHFLMAADPVRVGANAKWAGYAAKANGVREVTGEWTVPTIDCSQVPSSSAVGVWAGIDGFGNNKLVKAGVGITCASPSASPCYYLFTEVRPGTENPITACGGVSPGDDLSVDIQNSPFGSSSFVITIVDNGNAVGQPITVTAPSKRDQSAECVVELPPGNVGETPQAHYTKLADFGSVSFTGCSATASPIAGTNLDSDELAEGSDGAFKVTSLNMGTLVNVKATTTAPDWPASNWSVSWVSAK
jgi:hypothetical protein